MPKVNNHFPALRKKEKKTSKSQSVMGQDRFSSLALLYMEHNVLKVVDCRVVIREFANLKAKKCGNVNYISCNC